MIPKVKRTRQQAGRFAKAVGDLFEGWFAGQCDFAKRKGQLAHIHHNEPKTVITKAGLKHAKKSVADNSGALEGGRSLVAETKSTGSIDFPRSEVLPLQQDHLERNACAGGLSLLVVEFRSPRIRRFSVPWMHVPWQVKQSAETVTAELLAAGGWEIMMDGGFLDKFHPGGPSSMPHNFRIYPRD